MKTQAACAASTCCRKEWGREPDSLLRLSAAVATRRSPPCTYAEAERPLQGDQSPNPLGTPRAIPALAIRSSARPALGKRLQHGCRPRAGGLPAKVDVSRQRDIRMAELISSCS